MQFILDMAPLSKAEQSLTGHYQSYHAILTSRVNNQQLGVGGRRSASRQSTSSRCTTIESTPSSSVGSLHSLRLDQSKGNGFLFS